MWESEWRAAIAGLQGSQFGAGTSPQQAHGVHVREAMASALPCMADQSVARHIRQAAVENCAFASPLACRAACHWRPTGCLLSQHNHLPSAWRRFYAALLGVIMQRHTGDLPNSMKLRSILEFEA